MDYLNKQLEYIRNQLSTLTRSGQIAAGLLILLVVIGTAWMANYYGSGSAWTPLLDQSVKSEDAQRIQAELAIVGIDSKIDADRILVRGGEDARQRSQAILAQKGALPSDMSLGFQSLIEKSNPFIGDKEMDRRWNVGLQTEIAGVIKRFGGIRNATVLIQVPRKRGFLMSSREKGGTSASVNVETDYGSALSDSQVMAISNFVAGAVEGLSPMNVSITDGSRHYRTPDPRESLATNMLDKQRNEEKHYREMIYDQLRFVNGLVANVRVKLRDEEASIENKELGGKPAVISETEESMETKSARTAAGPGVRPNQGASVGDAGSGNTSTTNKTDTVFSEQRDVKLTSIRRPMGLLDMLTASISIPHSYLEGVYRKTNAVPDDQAVTHEQIEAIAAVKLPEFSKQIETLLYEKQGQDRQIAQVAVDWHYDIPMQAAMADEALAGAGVDYVAMIKSYGPQAGLAFLAIVPLWYVLRMAKKAQVAVATASEASGGDAPKLSAQELESLGGGPVTVGEAEGMHSAMVGHEVDESLVRTQQIMEQIAELVKEDPDSAANIVQNWLQEAGV